ncbi:sulfatase [Planctomycetota bacterium]|nr:sulfatase [Planctomycetota bacterium]
MIIEKPNIIYLHSHDTGRYIQPYGYPVQTPNLQAFAESGTVFRDAHCANPTCSPARACLLTGQYAHQNGMYGLAHLGWSLKDYKKHILHTLHDHGYVSALGGFQHIAAGEKPHATIGYQRKLDCDSSAHGVADAAINYFNEKHEKPFFLSLGTFETHRPFPEPLKKHNPKYKRPPATFPDTKETRHDYAAYCTMAEVMDEAYGRIFDALIQTSLADNTIVICTTDHGIAFPKMKCNLTSHGTGVLLIMKGPGIQPGQVNDALISQVDIFPTICDCIGIKHPNWLEGQSFKPVIDGQKDQIQDSVFASVNVHVSKEVSRMARTKELLYIRRYGSRNTVALPNCDSGLTKNVLMRSGWQDKYMDREYLFDLIHDPMETCNVATQSDYQDKLQHMRGRLEAWQIRTSDPLLHGDIPIHGQAIIKDPNEIEP